MRARWWQLLSRLDRYYDQDWRVVWFQPILCLFMFGVSLRLLVTTNLTEPFFETVLGFDFYHVWLGLGMLCPLLAGVSWLMIRYGGRAGVLGRGVRLGADVGILTVLLSYHAVSALTAVNMMSESRVFARYILAAVMIFVLELILRDVWAIRLVNIRAGRLRRGR